LATILALEEAALLNTQPAPAVVDSIQSALPADLNELLARASNGGHFHAAAEFAAELGSRGDMLALVTADGRPSPLVEALESANRALRFATLGAVMEIDPQAPFPGSSRVVEALWAFALCSGEPTAVAASPIATQATTWAGQLLGLGFDAAATETGRAALQEAVSISRSPRLEAVVLDVRIASPPLREVIYQLRANRATSVAPVIVMCASERLHALRDLSEADPLTLVAPRADSDEAMADLVERALAHTDSAPPTSEMRRLQAEQALMWIHGLAKKVSPYDELMRNAALLSETLYAAELTELSLKLLANVGAGAAQSSLVNYASSHALPLELRRVAVESLASNVRRHGLQLTRSQILQQYDRYNSSETADRQTQQLLSRVLDVVEGKVQP
jgi:hypothetical protein